MEIPVKMIDDGVHLSTDYKLVAQQTGPTLPQFMVGK